MEIVIAVAALVLAYAALVAAYLALRTLARLRRASAILGQGGGGRETIIEAAERHIALTTAVARRLDEVRAELDGVRAELRATHTATEQGAEAEHSSLARYVGSIEAKVAADTARALRNVALVRYDAFDDMAGRMSFSLALLDDSGDGVTLSAIAGRTDTRVYAKGVHGGAGEHELSPEEVQAIGAALRTTSGRRIGPDILRRKAS